jgi:hypothetical protein
MLGEDAPDQADFGTLKVYERYHELVGLVSSRKIDLGTWYTPGTPPQVERILHHALRSEQRLILTMGDAESGQAWDDTPSRGTISRSMGPLKVPILISRRGAHGGSAILTDCIVRIQDSKTKNDLYRHPTFTVAVEPVTPTVTAAPAPAASSPSMR